MPFDFEKLDKDCEKEIAEAKSKKQKLKPTYWITLTQYKVKITFLGSLTSIDIYNKNDSDNCLPLEVEVIDKETLRKLAYKILEIYGEDNWDRPYTEDFPLIMKRFKEICDRWDSLSPEKKEIENELYDKVSNLFAMLNRKEKPPPKDILKDWIIKKKIIRFGKNVDEIADEILELLAKKI